ncbi:MAG: MBL fold metallo-hydrolase [Ruminococcaceae bacterium]|nr:MBL fold metallo-hydrolase [Oscillospiraceae bacterium]
MATLHFLRSTTDTINTSFILESNGTLLVVDGGYVTETPYVYEYLKKLGGHVTAWFLTHFHDDHYGCLFTMLNEHPDIRVDKLFYTFPSDGFLTGSEAKQTALLTETWLRIVRDTVDHFRIPVVEPVVGDVFEFDGGKAVVRILRTYDESLPTINNSTTVLRFEADGKSILFLGDLGYEGGQQLLETVDHSLIKADYCQMAHHGQGGVGQEVYEVVRPDYCLWPTPSWLWDNMGPGGQDTGPFQTLITRGWISSLHCVKRHYLMTEGTHVIDLAEN